MIVAVDGLDGSGKSRLAVALVEALTTAGHPASILHVDDFRRPIDFEGLDPAAESERYYDGYYDFAALEAALARHVAAAPPSSVTVVEGVMPLRAELPASTWLLVLEVSAAEARRRILARDQAKGRSPEEVARRIDRRYFPAQARYRAAHDPLGRAHAVIDNQDWRRPRLLRRAADLPPALVAALSRVLEAAV